MKDPQDKAEELFFKNNHLKSLQEYQSKLESKLTDENGEFLYNADPVQELRLLNLYQEIEDVQKEK